MKKFNFKIHGSDYEVHIINLEDNIAEIDVNGSLYKVEIQQEIKAQKTPKLVRSRVVSASEGEASKTSKPGIKKGTGAIKAPLPGVILELNVKVGDKVKPGHRLLIMEAMKMENNINSDTEGVVESIKVNIGDSVLEGDLLIEIGV